MLPTIPLGSSVFAVYEVNQPTSEVDNVSIQMINNNQDQKIGLAALYMKELNGMCQSFQYNVTGKVTLQEYLVRTLTQEEFRRMILNLVSTIEGFDEYMIDTKRIMLEPDTVYINMLDSTISFICIPLQSYQNPVTLYDFFRGIVDRSYVSVNSGGISYFDCVRNIIKSESGFSLSNIRTSMNMMHPEQNAAAPGAPAAQTAPQIESGQLTQPQIPEQVPDTITISSANEPVYVPPVPPVEDPSKKEKKSLFGGLFGSSQKGAPKGNQKKKKEKGDAQAGGFQGGLAGLKSGAKKLPDAPQIPPPVSVPPVQIPPQVPSQVPPQSPVNAAPLNFGGTTVLSSGMANPPMPAPPVQPAQTVQPLQPVQQPMQQPMQPAFQGGTTNLNNAMPEPVQPVPVPGMGQVSLQKGMPDAMQAQPAASKGTTVLRPSGNVSGPATTVLSPNSARKSFLMRVKTHQRMQIEKNLVRIGRDTGGLDFNVTDNTNVGHTHANIVRHGDDFYLVDLHSLNHTYLNEVELEGGKEYPLTDGDRFTCADEEFLFTMG